MTEAERYEEALSWANAAQRPTPPRAVGTDTHRTRNGGWLPVLIFDDGSVYLNTLGREYASKSAALRAAIAKARGEDA